MRVSILSKHRVAPVIAVAVTALMVGASVPARADVTPGTGPAAGGTSVTGTVSETADTKFAQISTGSAHSVALDSQGQAYSWGDGYWGGLGNGTSGGTAGESAVPVEVTQGDLVFTQVSAGDAYSLALTDDGTIYAWGYGSLGALGDGGTQYRTTPVPASTPSGVTFKAISANDGHSLALASDGRVWSWGDNTYRQLGRPGGAGLTPAVVPGSPVFAALGHSPGAASSFAITSSGGGYAWGRNYSGQLGIGTEVPSSQSNTGVETPTAMVGGFSYAEIHSVGNRTTMLTTGGVVTTTGEQPPALGQTTAFDQLTPVAVDTGAVRFRSIGVWNHVVGAATDGRVYTWGSNEEGERGDGTFRTPYSTTLHQVTFGGSPVRATEVHAGRYYSLGYDAASGQVRGWGYGYDGQLGDGVMQRQPSPTLGAHWRITGATFGGTPATDVFGTPSSWTATTPPATAEGPVAVRVTATLFGGGSAGTATRDFAAGQYVYGTVDASSTAFEVTGQRVSGQTLTLRAAVTPRVAGTIEFLDGARVLRSVPAPSGTATHAVKLPAGSHALSARFVPGSDGAVAPSASSRTSVSVAKAKPTLTVRAPKQVRKGQKAAVSVVVRAAGLVATGKVSVSVARRTASGTLRNGKVTVVVKNLTKVGRNQAVTVAYAGSTQVAAAKNARTKLSVTTKR